MDDESRAWYELHKAWLFGPPAERLAAVDSIDMSKTGGPKEEIDCRDWVIVRWKDGHLSFEHRPAGMRRLDGRPDVFAVMGHTSTQGGIPHFTLLGYVEIPAWLGYPGEA